MPSMISLHRFHCGIIHSSNPIHAEAPPSSALALLRCPHRARGIRERERHLGRHATARPFPLSRRREPAPRPASSRHADTATLSALLLLLSSLLSSDVVVVVVVARLVCCRAAAGAKRVRRPWTPPACRARHARQPLNGTPAGVGVRRSPFPECSGTGAFRAEFGGRGRARPSMCVFPSLRQGGGAWRGPGAAFARASNVARSEEEREKEEEGRSVAVSSEAAVV